MTKRLSAGVVLAAVAVLFTAMVADAKRPPAVEVRQRPDRYDTTVPLFFRSSAGTTWVQVGQKCQDADTVGRTHAINEVWCFDDTTGVAAGDSTWPSIGSQGSGATTGAMWSHWSRYSPPTPEGSKWHVTTFFGGDSTGSFNAWCGCDSIGTNPECDDTAFWINKTGYGDEWNYALTLDMSSWDASSGGTIEFDIRYDLECDYDYMYLEYFDTNISQWAFFNEGGQIVRFNGTTGGTINPTTPCGDDYFDHRNNYGAAPVWLWNVVFTIPSQAGGMQLRWRGKSDQAWSDEDGNGDTHGMAAIDNVTAKFNASPGDSVFDDFESGDFTTGPTVTANSASWLASGAAGDTFDGWHLEFDPKYKNKGNVCEFNSDWMWAAKPATSQIPANGFSYFLVSPRIRTNDGVNPWSGGLVQWDYYFCLPQDRTDYKNEHVRYYDTVAGSWSTWQDLDGVVNYGGCDFWVMDNVLDVTTLLGPTVDSLQVAWELIDNDIPGDFEWGYHQASQFIVDDVSFGYYDNTATTFTTTGSFSIFGDTFSLVDPMHAVSLTPSEEGNWDGNGGTRAFTPDDSLAVQVNDPDGITSANVNVHWRVGTGTPPTFGAWTSKTMVFTDQDPNGTPGEGTYRAIIGNTTTEDYSLVEDTDPGDVGHNPDAIWDPGMTIEYYVRVTDDLANPATFPTAADGTDGTGFVVRIHPFLRDNGLGKKVLLVDDAGHGDLDFENSQQFDPNGAINGFFGLPVIDTAEDLVQRALILMYGGEQDLELDPNGQNGYGSTVRYDVYNTANAGGNRQREPRIIANTLNGLGGIADDVGNPLYDAVIWLNGRQEGFVMADTTRLEMAVMLGNGGKLFWSGDELGLYLGTGGSNSDSTVQFSQNWLGWTFTNINDDQSTDKVLDVVGVAATALDGVQLGLYGECPIRANFDKLNVVSPAPAGHTNTVLATYQNSDAATNGRSAIIQGVHNASGGCAVTTGFNTSALVTDNSRAVLLSKIFDGCFGVAHNFTGGFNSGTDAPVVAGGRFGFDLAQATPNPFSDATTIRFSVPSRTHVSIEVYNILGQKVRTLVDETLEGNSYVREWDGRSDAGARASSGIYFYKMVAGDYSATRKAVMLK